MSLLRLVLGVICGIAATGPMSVVMVLLHRRLPVRERYPLPPREITSKAVEQVVEPDEISPATRSALTWLAHFGYGGAAGALYAEAERRLPGGAAVRGPLFGLLVWTVSYLGLLPGLRVLTPATEHPLRRSALMIAAHLVWGWFLAMIYQVLFSDLWRESTAFHVSPRPHQDTEPRIEEWVPGNYRR
jgi:uncharacterized membrane protein YagU involved in acid resistance